MMLTKHRGKYETNMKSVVDCLMRRFNLKLVVRPFENEYDAQYMIIFCIPTECACERAVLSGDPFSHVYFNIKKMYYNYLWGKMSL